MFLGSSEKNREKEERYFRAMGSNKIPRMSARQSALQYDQEKWENQRLQSSGVITQQGVLVLLKLPRNA